jgi:glutamate mutase epsilon subunit
MLDLGSGSNAMSKSITLEISEAEAANLESSIDQLLKALRQLDEGHEQRWPEVERLKAETHVIMEQIRATLNVEKAL